MRRRQCRTQQRPDRVHQRRRAMRRLQSKAKLRQFTGHVLVVAGQEVGVRPKCAKRRPGPVVAPQHVIMVSGTALLARRATSPTTNASHQRACASSYDTQWHAPTILSTMQGLCGSWGRNEAVGNAFTLMRFEIMRPLNTLLFGCPAKRNNRQVSAAPVGQHRLHCWSGQTMQGRGRKLDNTGFSRLSSSSRTDPSRKYRTGVALEDEVPRLR